ncbi:MAG TPA: ATP-dependent DNA ligase [Thermoplasmata archaeon]|nr:ATP-dependent DNA ligase [Thermoplasmata archaeon]
MQFADLVATYEKLGATTKRLEMRSLLSELLKRVEPAELPEVLYLSQGLLRPEYEGVELGVADSLARRALAEASGTPEKEIQSLTKGSGDLGLTAETLLAQAQRSAAGAGTVADVYASFREVATASGEGSQDRKVEIIAQLLRRASPTEAKYVLRFVLGTLRLGVREMSLLDALGVAFADGSKEARQQIEGAFNVSSDLGVVAHALATKGLPGLEAIHLTVGRPIRPMLAERSPTLEDLLKRMEGTAVLEYKYDGLRIQAHLPEHGPVQLFSRRLEAIGAQFPELLRELPKAIRRRPAIVEGECVSVDLETGELRPFQAISRRRGRKYDLERIEGEIPVRLFLFDLLLEGEHERLAEDYPERRRHLEALVDPKGSELVVLATQERVGDAPAATRFFDQAIADGCEGVMGKSVAPGSRYRAGARGFWWIKYKREYTQALADTIDGVVVGGFAGRGRRAGTWGALLVATFEPESERFESFCKVGSGFDDETLDGLKARLKPFEVAEKPEEVVTELTPDQWFRPSVVLELRGAELSLSPIHCAAVGKVRPGVGLALRFPRFTGKWRPDKGETDATTSAELLGLYRSQVRQEAAVAPEETESA